jgi:hypothetical protein
LSNRPGADLWAPYQGSPCRDRRVPSFASSIDPDLQPMKQASTSAGWEYQLNRNSVFSMHYIHNNLLETIEDLGALDAGGNEVYVISNPGPRHRLDLAGVRCDGAVRDSASEAPVRRRRTELQPPVLGQLLLQRELHD